MIKIFPAIDIKDGKCVRLAKGNYDEVTHYYDDPIKVANNWISEGSSNLHIVDLDGAKSGATINYNVITKIRKTYPKVFIQVGGGIRTIETINEYINIGINKIVIGTKVVSDPSFLEEINEDLKSKIIVDIAIKNSKLAIHGWNSSSKYTIENYIKILEDHNISEIVYTDVNKDGMLNGMNFEEINSILSFSNIPVIASGGVTSINDIKKLNEISKKGVSGVIIGKALYEERVKLSDAIKIGST